MRYPHNTHHKLIIYNAITLTVGATFVAIKSRVSTVTDHERIQITK